MPNLYLKDLQFLITNQDLCKIYKVAELWEQKLSNKAIVLFYQEDKSHIKYETICFKNENFAHLNFTPYFKFSYQVEITML